MPARQARPTANVTTLVSGSSTTICQTALKNSCSPPSIPSIFGTCFTLMTSASPNTNPSSTDDENSRAIRPSRSSPATHETSPASRARAAVSVTYSAVPCGASSLIVAAEVIATADDTATTSCRELPSSAYRSRAAGAA